METDKELIIREPKEHEATSSWPKILILALHFWILSIFEPTDLQKGLTSSPGTKIQIE